jgi:ABC-2 type transport system permease protein
MLRTLHVYPALLRVGFASALAYRAEFIVWVLTTNMPLINLALWAAVSRDSPVASFSQADFVAYFLATQVVRLCTGCWVVWEMTQEIRQGLLAMRLLRPLHPLVAYSAEQLAAIPLRVAISLPFAVILLVTVGSGHLSHDPVVWLLLPLSVAGAWIITFLVMALVGTMALFVDSASTLFEVWFAFYSAFSGYIVPLELFPAWLQRIAHVLPFRLMLGVQVEAMIGRLNRMQLLESFAWQAMYIAVFGLALRSLWNSGMRRYAAFGG